MAVTSAESAKRRLAKARRTGYLELVFTRPERPSDPDRDAVNVLATRWEAARAAKGLHAIILGWVTPRRLAFVGVSFLGGRPAPAIVRAMRQAYVEVTGVPPVADPVLGGGWCSPAISRPEALRVARALVEIDARPPARVTKGRTKARTR